MKYCEITIEKDRSGAGTKFLYPQGFEDTKHRMIFYEDVGNAKEHALSVVPDDFDFTQTGYQELTKTEVEKRIDHYVETDRHLKASEGMTLEEVRDSIKQRRKLVL